MSTPDQPESSPLTRRRLREIRATGATPVILPAEDTEAVAPPAPEPTPAPTPLPRPAEPVSVGPAPLADASVDLGVSPLTRRQARAQERIRTASVPVIQPDAIPAGAPVVTPAAEEPAVDVEPLSDDREKAADASPGAPTAGARDAESEVLTPSADAEEESHPPAVVNPELGSDLLVGDAPPVSLPPSFDQLIARGSSATGSVATPNALILSQTPTATPLAPITATGEVLITGSFDLPEGLGSVGHAHGTTDGKDVDATLIDGELPASSSPTPIAASAAISTARHAGEEIIRPPAPEKGNKLMLALVITAGVLALALVGVLILAVTTGVFA
ncbi:hypothetical protein ACTU3I_17350 [Microbacterium sp. RD1]|uniref:hypothetical protein n=1 Tax=Microbacterium sp. RD1 TaxID=3457313 RepID=UPI003FA5D025